MLKGALKFSGVLLSVLYLWASLGGLALAQESVCARVKIEIKQDLTLERQAFDAEMRITNSLPATSLTEVSVVVNVTDELGAPVSVTTDPNNLNAKFSSASPPNRTSPTSAAPAKSPRKAPPPSTG